MFVDQIYKPQSFFIIRTGMNWVIMVQIKIKQGHKNLTLPLFWGTYVFTSQRNYLLKNNFA